MTKEKNQLYNENTWGRRLDKFDSALGFFFFVCSRKENVSPYALIFPSTIRPMLCLPDI